MNRRSASQHGFTLVELMVTIVIIGILALLAVVTYQRLIRSSHTSEATQMVNAIKIAQEAYHAEVGTYVSISANLDTDLCPAHAVGPPTNVSWDPTCGTGVNRPWSNLPVSSGGAVLFGYATVAGPSGVAMQFPTMSSAPPATTPTTDWYVVSAKGDMDGNGVFCTVLGTSLSRNLYIDRDGE